MKKLYLFPLLSFFTFGFCGAQTNVYHPIPDSGIVWRESNEAQTYLSYPCYCYYFGGFNLCLNDNDYEYALGGDTTIGSNVYKKVLQTGNTVAHLAFTDSCPPGVSQFTTYYYRNYYVGGLRQDTNQRKVFFISTLAFAQDTLLYDFNLHVGDTLPGSFNNYYYPDNYISSIDSISIKGSYHRRFWITDKQNNDTNYAAIVEGIGSTLGLLFPIGPNSPFMYSTLKCVTIDSIPVYPDTATVCVLVTSVKEIEQENFVSLYPNPAANQITIHISSFNNEHASIIITNVLGQQTSPPAPLHMERGDGLIDVSGLNAGMYFVEVVGESGRWVGRFVKE